MQIDIEKIRKEKSIQELLKFSIINLDKPTGPTSFQVSQFVKLALKLNKTSHFGTLDPMVTGVLPVALGRACRLNDYFMHRDKTYVGIMRIHQDISEEKLQEVIKKFIGKIMQLPPVRSRVKRAIREREVKTFQILEIGGKDVLFKTQVQAGTYIRKLCDDIGKEIGGAHMLELRRVQAGMFTETTSINLYDLEKAVNKYKDGDDSLLRSILIPAEIISHALPVIQIDSPLKSLLTGKPLMKQDIKENLPDSDFFVIFHNQTLIGVYHPTKEKDIIARPDFIFN